MLLLRLTPLTFSFVSYFLGITRVCIRQYLLGSSIISIYIALWLYIGNTLVKVQSIKPKLSAGGSGGAQSGESEGWFEMALLGFEILMAFGLGCYISVMAKRELDRKISA